MIYYINDDFLQKSQSSQLAKKRCKLCRKSATCSRRRGEASLLVEECGQTDWLSRINQHSHQKSRHTDGRTDRQTDGPTGKLTAREREVIFKCGPHEPIPGNRWIQSTLGRFVIPYAEKCFMLLNLLNSLIEGLSDSRIAKGSVGDSLYRNGKSIRERWSRVFLHFARGYRSLWKTIGFFSRQEQQQLLCGFLMISL